MEIFVDYIKSSYLFYFSASHFSENLERKKPKTLVVECIIVKQHNEYVDACELLLAMKKWAFVPQEKTWEKS